ncbi:uncharacterized protein Bfra_010323, partial [Botrytis fragariae]
HRGSHREVSDSIGVLTTIFTSYGYEATRLLLIRAARPILALNFRTPYEVYLRVPMCPALSREFFVSRDTLYARLPRGIDKSDLGSRGEGLEGVLGLIPLLHRATF